MISSRGAVPVGVLLNYMIISLLVEVEGHGAPETPMFLKISAVCLGTLKNFIFLQLVGKKNDL